MATALELFEIFLQRNSENEYVYQLHELEELLSERNNEREILFKTHRELAELSESANEIEVYDLNINLKHQNERLIDMERVLAFVGSATQGYLITKVVNTVEWYCQEPVYFTQDADKANQAFDFFNAYAIIAQQ
jgi:hypothetical protein